VTLWLRLRRPKSRGGDVNIDKLPLPTVSAQSCSIGDTCKSHWWIESVGEDEYMPDPNKPPYRVPSMTEVAKIRGTNGYTCASTFSGAGGSCLGYEMAGFRVAWASEFVHAAQEVYRLNHPDTHLDTRDIREVRGSEILDACGLGVGELDLFDGSPPCASFSTAGKREKNWGKVKKYSDRTQRTDDLFFEYARLIEDMRPKVFVAENVSGLVKGSAKGYFQLIMRELKSKGYRVKAKLLDAKWLGVPQSRQRLIFMGVREDLELDPVYPKPLAYFYSVRDALPWITRAVHDTSGIMSTGEYTDKASPAITVSGGAAHHHHKIYGPMEDRRPIAPSRASGNWQSAKQVDPEAPASTVTIASHGNDLMVSAPTEAETNLQRVNSEPRKFTIGELKRICAFPDDFELTGTYGQQWERLGRAVPPLMMRAVAEVVRDEILAKVKS
jgi:DNA (cytosine-5)-methyltransferase 1